MSNPWNTFDFTQPNQVHQLDQVGVDAFNDKVGSSRSKDAPFHKLSTTHTPLPFFGAVDAQLVILGANPGLDLKNTDQEETPELRQLFDLSRKHELEKHPFVFLRPEFEGTPGYEWWLKRTKSLREGIGHDEFVAKTFSAEIHPYKSVKYRELTTPLPTQAYTFQLVEQLVQNGAWVILLRCEKEWKEAVPSLAASTQVIKLNSAQNSAMTPGNMPEGAFDKLIDALQPDDMFASYARALAQSSQKCVNCNRPVLEIKQYPEYFCADCVNLAVDADGNRLTFENGWSGGVIEASAYAAVSNDLAKKYVIAPSETFWINGRPCFVTESFAGGILVRPQK